MGNERFAKFINKLKGLITKIAGEESVKKYLVILGILLAVSLLLELFVFNYKWIGSCANKPEMPDFSVQNAVLDSENIYKSKGGDCYILINDIDRPISYLDLNIKVDGSEINNITISAKDEANGEWLDAPSCTLAENIERSHYIRLHYSGNVSDLRIKFKADKDKNIEIKQLELNPKVPLMFSFGRMLFVWLLLALLFMFRPGSFLYKAKLDIKSRWQTIVLCILVIVIAVGFWPIAKMDPWCDRNVTENVQYQKLAEALTKGEVSIGTETDSKMLALENPYDRQVRGNLGKWDNAYYKGKYYVYFGVAPVILYYLPYYLATGKPLKNSTAVYISCVLAAAAILFMLWQLARKWFKNISFGIYLLTALICIIGGGIIFTVKRPDLYPLPIITACMFATFGLGFWMSAKRENADGKAFLSKWRLAVGSLFMAAVAASRPQILLTSAFALPIFWNEVFKERRLFSKNSIKETAAVCLPYVIVAVLVMWYNYIRFESPFDFGANYNLTSNDMAKRGFVFGRIGLGLFTYLFQLPQIKAVFPFLNVISVETAYQGLTIHEKFFGGVMATELFLWIGVFTLFSKRIFKDRRIYAMAWLAYVIAVVIVILDTQMAGLLRRYFGDFLWIMYFGAALSVFALYEYFEKRPIWKNRFIKAVLVCLVAAIVFHGLEIFVDSAGWGIIHTNEVLYHKLKYLIAFWM